MKQYDDIDQINDSLDIIDLIGNSSIVKNFHQVNSDRYAGHTGSHSNSGASLIVTPSEQKWHDKATGHGGLAFNWIAYELLGISNPRGKDVTEVLKVAAEKAGIKLNYYTDEDKAVFQEKEEILSLNEKVNERWVNNLQNNPEMLEDLRKRHGLTPEQAKEHGIGYAIGNEDLKGFENEILIKSGLVYSKEGKRGSAFFQHRITYPYFKNGRIIYFSGRLTELTPEWDRGENNSNKYKKLQTYSEKHPYVSKTVKNDTIYGQDTIRGKDFFIITEGIGDCLALHCAGLPAISPITTTFPKHDIPKLLDLAKKVSRVYIVNDSEESEAGEKGAVKTAEILEAKRITANIIILPRPEGVKKVDVAEFLRDNSVEEFRKLLDSKHASFNLWEYKLSKVDVSGEDKGIERIRAFKSFIEDDLSGMNHIEWEFFVGDAVRKKFKLTLKDAQKTVTEALLTRIKRPLNISTERELEEGEEEEKADPLKNFPEWAINKANDILNNGDPFQFVLDIWQKRHVGDTNIGENCLCSVITSQILNSKRGLHIKPSGESGKGKSDAIECFLELLPIGSYITGSISAKALFYDKSLKPGTLIYSDDASFTEDVISTIKQSTSKFQNQTIHRTVVNGESQNFTIPERVTFWFSAVEGMDDDQLANRFLHADVDSSREQDERVHQHQKDSEAWYESDIVEPDVEVCRCIFTMLFSEFYRVKIPYIDAITWNNTENRRNFDKFKDVIRAVTAYNCRKRKVFEGFLMATPEDFERALTIYKGTSVNNATNLTDTELKYLRYIVNAPYKTVTLKTLVNHFKVSETAVRKMLNGKKGDGGLLAKVKQLVVIHGSSTVKNDNVSQTTRENRYQYTGEFTGLDMYESISTLDYDAVERVTQEFKARLYENKTRVTQGNPVGNLPRVTLENNNGKHNNIINNTRITQNIENERGEKFLPPFGNGNNSEFEKTSDFSQVTPFQAKQGYPHTINNNGSHENKGNPDRLPRVTQGYPQQKNNDGNHETEGYPSHDNDLPIKTPFGEEVTPEDPGLSNLLRKALIKLAKTEYKGAVADLHAFVKDFNERTPEYKEKLGHAAVIYNAEKLKARGWK